MGQGNNAIGNISVLYSSVAKNWGWLVDDNKATKPGGQSPALGLAQKASRQSPLKRR